MFLESIFTAVPPHRYTQPECLAAFKETPAYAQLNRRSKALIKAILGNGISGIASRSFCMPEIASGVGRSAQELNETFEREAPLLAIAALSPALEKAGLRGEELDALFV